MSADPPVPLIRNAAIVTGLPAGVLARLATDAWRRGRFDQLPDDDRRRIAATIAALHAAAEGWRTSVAGNAETDLDVLPASSEQLDVTEAAAMLKLTTRQVRNLATDLGGVQVAGRWLFDADAIVAEVERRGVA